MYMGEGGIFCEIARYEMAVVTIYIGYSDIV